MSAPIAIDIGDLDNDKDVRTVWFGPEGSDEKGDGTPENPFKSAWRAIEDAGYQVAHLWPDRWWMRIRKGD